LLDGIAADPETAIGRLPLLDHGERAQLTTGWNATATEYPRDRSISSLVEDRVAERPDAIATTFGAAHMTYAQLNRRANQVAHYLLRAGVSRGSHVAVCVDRGPNLIVAMLAILKCGAAYV